MTTPARPIRLAYLVSHPIQYQAPLLRRIAGEPGIELTVFFGSDFSLRPYADPGFGTAVHWDTPLLDGYRYEILPSLRVGGSPGPFSPISRGLFTRLRRGGFDVLWAHGYASINSLQAMLAARALGIPVLLRAESTLEDRPRSWRKLAAKRVFFTAIRPLVDAVLPIGSRNAAYWTHTLGPRVPQFAMPYAVDNTFFLERTRAAGAARGALEAELGLDPALPVILFASKLQPRKLCGDLVAAYAALPPKVQAHLVIVGDGEERGALERQVGGLPPVRLAGVRFAGFRNQTELPRFFDLATVFVLPSRHEPWGLIVNEAMAAGCPVIVSNGAGCQPDLVRDGREGCVFPTGDIPALTAALVGVLTEPGAARRMGDQARATIGGWSFEQDVAGLTAALAYVTGRAAG